MRLRTRLLAVISTTVLAALSVTSAAQAAPSHRFDDGWFAVGSEAVSVQDQAAEVLTLLVERSDSGGRRAEINALRASIAVQAADAVGADRQAMVAAWAKADDAHLTALMAAITQIGTPYRRNTSRPGVGFDCSGLTSYAWGRAGVSLARQSGSQMRSAARRDASTAQAGDLVYYPGHVMIWLGVENKIIHAPFSGTRVRFDHTAHRSLRYADPLG